MSIKHEAVVPAQVEVAPSRRAILAGAVVLATTGLPLVEFAAMPAQGSQSTAQPPLQLNGASMPKIIIHAPEGTFVPAARAPLATELTDFALDCEALPKSPFIKSTVWTYFNTYHADAVFMGGAQAHAPIISVQMFVIARSLDEKAKKKLIKGATEILGRHSAARGNVPVYIVLHEIPEINWGFLGETADLDAMRASPLDKPAL